MTGIVKATLGLAAFVVVLGAVLWAGTGRPYFAAFIVLGLLTGVGAWWTSRTLPPVGGPTLSSNEENK